MSELFLTTMTPLRAGRRLVLRAAMAVALVCTLAPPVSAQARGELPDFTELVEKVGPAVVNIRTTERARAARGGVGPELDEDMLEFFRRFGLPIPNRPNPRGGPQQPTRCPGPREQPGQLCLRSRRCRPPRPHHR